MKLSILLENLGEYKILGSKDKDVRLITDDSRLVKKSSLFVAIKGLKFDGHNYIDNAVLKGASVVVCERLPKNKGSNKVTFICCKNSRRALGLLSSSFYDNPSLKLSIIGVTGTDGKTTTASLIYHFLQSAGKKAGLITTIGAKIGQRLIDTGLHVTSPNALVLQKILADMVKEKCEYVVLEVTSHGLDQERVAGVKFDYGVITNITNEHLDYHKSFGDYQMAKSKLFAEVKKSAVLNKDDQSFFYIKQVIPASVNISTYSINDKNTTIYTQNIKENTKTYFEVVEGVQSYSLETNLLGIYNISNILAAIGVCRLIRLDPNNLRNALLSFTPPQGRLEKLKIDKGFNVYIDFAHTPNALRNVLMLLRKTVDRSEKKGKLICIFGCAGERDKQKRLSMGEISSQLADISVFTAEDPRSEDVNKIIQEIAEGGVKTGAKEIKKYSDGQNDIANFILLLKKNDNPTKKHYYIRIPDREEAINFTLLKIADDNDIVVLCGKGHEKSMAYGEVEHPWNDKKVVEEILGRENELPAIVFAAGRGKRMGTRKPKVLQKIAGRPMILYTLHNLRLAGFGKIIFVVGYGKDEIVKEIGPGVDYAIQKHQLGTGDALSCGLNALDKNYSNVIAMNGDDSGFYNPSTLNGFYNFHIKNNYKLTFASTILDNPFGIGRVIRDKEGKLLEIVEEKDTNEIEKKTKEVNIGLYVFNVSWVKNNIKKIKKSTTGEYYVIDLIKIAIESKTRVGVYKLKDNSQWFGVNTPEQLRLADIAMRKKVGDNFIRESE